MNKRVVSQIDAAEYKALKTWSAIGKTTVGAIAIGLVWYLVTHVSIGLK